MAVSNAAPYVSVVLTGRNDGYGGDFLSRFLVTLRFNHRELTARAIPHEFVLVEWAPPAGAPLLADLIEEQCPSSLSAAVRTIVVDPAYHDAMTLNPRLVYDEYIAKNVGARRSHGEQLIITNTDIFFGRQILDRLERREFEPSVVYRAARWDLTPLDAIERVDWAYLDDVANFVLPLRRLKPPLFAGGAGDFMGMARASFERLGGFNEVYRLARVGIDGNIVVLALASGFTIVDVGGPVYHVSHEGSYRATRERYVGREAEAPYGDERWPVDLVVYRNRPEWGLRAATERSIGPRRTYLDFSWEATPPLVDLSGIVVLPPDQRPTAGAAAV